MAQALGRHSSREPIPDRHGHIGRARSNGTVCRELRGSNGTSSPSSPMVLYTHGRGSYLILRMARPRSVASVPNSLVVACGRCAVGSSRVVVYVLVFFFSLSCLQLASFSLLCVDELFM